MNTADIPSAANPDKELVPRRLLIAVVALMLATLAIATFARVMDMPLAATPAHDMAISQEKLIIIDGQMNGAATVRDAYGAIIAELSPTEGGFVAGVQRVLKRERAKHNLGMHEPVKLIRYEDGRLSLHDEFTGWRAELFGFGEDNAKTFARFLN